MKALIHMIMLISGFIVATFLAFFCFIGLTSGIGSMYAICILGILGWIGMFSLFLEHRVNKWFIVFLLACGLASFMMFMTRVGAWRDFLYVERLLDLFLFTWPALVGAVNMVRLVVKKGNND